MLSAPRQPLDWSFDPLAALGRWPVDRRVALLHSGRYEARWAKRSILASPVASLVVRPVGDTAVISHWITEPTCEPTLSTPPLVHRPFRDVRAALNHHRQGLWIGYFSYDLNRHIEKLPSIAKADRDWPLIELGYCPGWLEYDLSRERWQACGTWAEAMPINLTEAPGEPAWRASDLTGVFTKSEYEAAVQRVIDYIAAGDIFQANLTQRFTATFEGAAPDAGRAMFRELARVSPAWYGALVELTPDLHTGIRRTLASTSPELFLEVDPQGHVTTRPIKGTRPAEVDASVLRDSEKDTAELNMIVDLMRNDLGRVCDYGSVRVTQPRTIESHPTIHHGVATIEGTLHASRDMVDLLRATLPGGSITGAPKVRAMQIIDELERVRRGPYCGAIGWLTPDAMTLNIAIRTMLLELGADASRVDFAVGGGVVADSTPAAEYDETIDKAVAILKTLRLNVGNSEFPAQV